LGEDIASVDSEVGAKLSPRGSYLQISDKPEQAGGNYQKDSRSGGDSDRVQIRDPRPNIGNRIRSFLVVLGGGLIVGLLG
jgi:hypothetical protein